jgi:hypothetical protein
MGDHYTRHVEAEVNVIRAFERVKDKPVNRFAKQRGIPRKTLA